MKIHQKYLIPGIVVSILIFMLSIASGQTQIKRSGTIFQQASVRIDENQDAPIEVRFEENQKVSVITFFEQYRQAFNWSDNNEARSFKTFTDKLGQTHHRFKQYYKGVELAEAQYLLHENEGFIFYAHGKLIHGLAMDVTPVISESEALKKALDRINAESYMWENIKNEAFIKKERNDREATFYPSGELQISSGLKEQVVENFRLVYRFDIFAEKPLSRNYVDVDARTSEIVGVLPRLYSEDVQGHGTTLYNGNVDIFVSDSNYYVPPNPPPNFHLDDWNAYGDSGESWWASDPNLGNQGGYADRWYEVLDTDPVILDGENLTLNFNHRYAVEFPALHEEYDGWDGMNVRISVDAGATWQVLLNPTPAYSNQSLYSFGEIHGEGPDIPGWAGVLPNWTKVSFDLSSFAGQTIQLRFAFASDGYVSTETAGDPDWFGWQIDDIVIANAVETVYMNDGSEDGMTAVNDVKEITLIPGNYRLRESGRGGGIVTFDAQNQTSMAFSVDFVDADSNFFDTDAQAGVSTHWAAEATYDYFLIEHFRNSYDNEGGRLISFAHYDSAWVNAMGGGGFMWFGDGDGSNYSPLVSLDVVGHEFTHSVTQFTADLIYKNESGALNESFSDIFGTAVEFFAEVSNSDWIIGEDFALSMPHFRSMKDPNSRDDPDTYLGDFWYTGTDDNGGVHTNSGVQNFWFYLLSEGGSGVNDNGDAFSVTGIGIEEAAQIAYRNLTVYLMPTSVYQDAKLASINSAIDLFGGNSQQYHSVINAWNAVGIYSPFTGPHAQNCILNGNYHVPEIDTLFLKSYIYNPDNHSLEVKSIIESFDQSVSDTISLFDDGKHNDGSLGDEIWGESWPIPPGERNYKVHISTTSLDSGYHNVLSDAAYFTTKGPVVLYFYNITSEDTVANPGDLLNFEFTLTNNGSTDSVYNVSIKAKSLNSCAEIFNVVDPYYGDIAPGESAVADRTISILFDTECPTQTELSFILEIITDNYPFWTDTFSVDIVTDVQDEKLALPKKFALGQNYPNPFNPTTLITYQLPKSSEVELNIYNVLGQKVITLVTRRQKAGYHQVEWDASGFASGVYYYRLQTDAGFVQSKKLILLK